MLALTERKTQGGLKDIACLHRDSPQVTAPKRKYNETLGTALGLVSRPHFSHREFLPASTEAGDGQLHRVKQPKA